MTIHILYHANCPDGLSSAWVAYQKFGDAANVRYHAAFYNDPLEKFDIEDGDTVYMVDYSRNSLEIVSLLARGVEVTVLDHHQTAEELAGLLPEYDSSFDFRYHKAHSGCEIAWAYFFPSKPIPQLLLHISDRDRWQFKLENTKLVHAGITGLPWVFRKEEAPEGRFIFDMPLEELCRRGKIILDMQEATVDKLCEQVFEVWVPLTDIDRPVVLPPLPSSPSIKERVTYKVPCVNTSILFSEVPHQLLQLYPDAAFAMYVYRRKDCWQYGLRGRGDFDVSKVAQTYGGGGHHDAAGFEYPELMFNI